MEKFSKADHVYTMNRMYMKDCRFSLSKEYKKQVDEYIKMSTVWYLCAYYFNVPLDDSLSHFAVKEVQQEFLNGNPVVKSVLDMYSITTEEFYENLMNLKRNEEKLNSYSR